jgi:peptidyl-prolyl cis-trans isomerase SurA
MQVKNTNFFILFVILVFFSLNIPCNEYQFIDKIVATAEKEVVTYLEVKRNVEKKLNNIDINKLSKSDLKKLEKETLDELIKEKLIIQYAKLIKIYPDNKEIDIVVSNILKQNNISIQDLELELESQKTNLKEFKSDLRNQLIVQRIKDREIGANIKVSEYEIEAWIKKNNSKIENEYLISHILIKNNNPKKREFINKVLPTLYKDNFGEIAEQFSDGPNAQKKGDLGWNKISELPDIFAEFLSNAKISEISQIIESNNGIHILKLENIKGNTKTEPILIRQYKFQQILLKLNVIQSDDELEKKLKNIKNLIEEGLDFTEAVKKYSEDQFNNNPKKLDWINYNNLLPQFRANLSSYPKENIIGPFKTEMGWHLVKIFDFQEKDITDDNEKQIARNEIIKRKSDIKFNDWVTGLIKNSEIKYFTDD